jgi:hypothetical protein
MHQHQKLAFVCLAPKLAELRRVQRVISDGGRDPDADGTQALRSVEFCDERGGAAEGQGGDEAKAIRILPADSREPIIDQPCRC